MNKRTGMPTQTFKNLLEQEPAIIFDGAMGTLLYARGVFINQCFDALNLQNPEIVEQIHREYVKAGAMVIETNTFGANRLKLKSFNLEDRVMDINMEGARIARRAAEKSALIAGSIGPLGVPIEPWGPTSHDQARRIFKEHATGLVQGGIDVFILETFGNIAELEQAVTGVRLAMEEQGVALPVMAHMTVDNDGNSLFGTEPEVFTAKMDSWEVDALGINCSVGPKIMLDVVERMIKGTTKPLSVMPNAGMPAQIDGRTIYLSSPEYFAYYARRFIQVGARIIGGCCGTTPEHIKKISDSIKLTRAERASIHIIDKRKQDESARDQKQEYPQVPVEEKSRLSKRISQGCFVASCEMTPPRGWELRRIIRAAEELKNAGFDTINIPDGPRASAKMGPLAMAVTIQQQVGAETILHYTCRDRNMLGMQSDLLGAYAVGLRNVLLITGDPPALGDYPYATGVFDVDAIGLTNMVTRLNHGYDIGDKSIGKPTGFFIGVGANPTAVNLDKEIERFTRKIDAGAEFAITQPVFDVRQLTGFLSRMGSRSIPVLAGIWPLQSLRNAEFLQNEVPGVSVPQWIIDEFKKCNGDGEAERRLGIEIAKRTLDEVHALVQGVQISAPFNRHEYAVELLEWARALRSKHS